MIYKSEKFCILLNIRKQTFTFGGHDFGRTKVQFVTCLTTF